MRENIIMVFDSAVWRAYIYDIGTYTINQNIMLYLIQWRFLFLFFRF